MYVEYRNPRIVPKLDGKDALVVSIDAVRQLGFQEAMDRHIARHWREPFFLKSRDWEAEREYRWLVRGDGDEDFFVGIKDSLVGIALGDRFPNELKNGVAFYAEKNPISLAVMEWQNGVPQPQPIPWRLLCQRQRKYAVSSRWITRSIVKVHMLSSCNLVSVTYSLGSLAGSASGGSLTPA